MIKEKTWNEILDVISGGMTDKDACLYSGISRQSFYKKIREESDFSDMVKKAQVEFKKKHLEIIADAGERSWQASAWLLERKFKPEFSRNGEIAVDKENEHEKMSIEELEEQINKYTKLEEDDKYKFKPDDELEDMWAKEIDRLRKTYKGKQAL